MTARRYLVSLTAAQRDALLRIADNALNDPDLWAGIIAGQPHDNRHAGTLARAVDALRAAKSGGAS